MRAAEKRQSGTESREPGYVSLVDNEISRSRSATANHSFLSGKVGSSLTKQIQ